MNKRILSVACIAVLLNGGLLRATTSQFRSPLQFIERAYTHYPLPPVEDTWWYLDTGHDRNESPWSVDIFKGLYARSANKSFFNSCDDVCSNGSTTRQTASLSQLWFGSDAFRGEQAYPGSFIATPTTSGCDNLASLSFSRITPRFEYNEYGAWFGIHAERQFGRNGNWRVGMRASMPVKVIEIELDQTCSLFETIDDVVKLCPISLDAGGEATEVDFAVRLDFLTALSIPDGDNTASPFVGYDNGTNTAPTFNNTRMADEVVSAPSAAATDGMPSVYTRASSNGCLPEYPFRQNPATQTITALPANGLVADGTVSFFQSDTNYAGGVGQDRNAQGMLFVVPRANPADPANSLVNGATLVEQNLQTLLEYIADSGGLPSPIDIFAGCTGVGKLKPCCGDPCAIDFCSAERITGQGDLNTEVYGGYAGRNWFTNLVFGVLFPTGTPARDARRIYYQTTGNNRHFEVKFRLEGGWRPVDWFAFELDGSYHHACKAKERRAAPFTGATVRNIGPQVDLNTSWNYFIGHADFTFFHPHNPEIGCSFGYELFAKGKDHVSLDCCDQTATDCLGNPNQSLNPCILERQTNSMTHKLRAEIFHRWEFFELTAGVSQVLAGRNAMKETEAHLGAVIYF